MRGDAENTQNGGRQDGGRTKDELEAQIRATQEELRHTIEAIGESLSPGEMLDAALHYARVGPGEFAASLGRSLRDNPVPVGLVGVGLTWLMLSPETKERAARRAKETSSSAAGEAKHLAGGAKSMAQGAKERAQGAKERAGGDGQVRDAPRRGAEKAREAAREYPVLLAVAGLFAGAAVAASVPRSRTEERIIGGRAEASIEASIEEVAHGAADAARGAAEGVRRGLEGDAPRGNGRTERTDGGA